MTTAPDATPAPARPQRSARLIFCTSVLWLEVFVVLFAALVGFGLRLADPALVWAVGGVGMSLCIAAAMVQRTRAGLVVGSAVQVALLACGLVIPTMWIVGGVFVVVWLIAVLLGNRIDRERAERVAAEEAAGAH